VSAPRAMRGQLGVAPRRRRAARGLTGAAPCIIPGAASPLPGPAGPWQGPPGCHPAGPKRPNHPRRQPDIKQQQQQQQPSGKALLWWTLGGLALIGGAVAALVASGHAGAVKVRAWKARRQLMAARRMRKGPMRRRHAIKGSGRASAHVRPRCDAGTASSPAPLLCRAAPATPPPQRHICSMARSAALASWRLSASSF
jgi:hypothetical protein